MNDALERAMLPKTGALAAWVELYTPTSEAPAAAHLGAALALSSAALGWKAWIRWTENAEPCTINVVLEGRSATARKTTVASSAQTLARAAMRDLDHHQAQLRVRSIGHTSDRGLIEAISAPDKETADRWEREPPPGTLLVWDEIGAILGRPGDVKGADWLGRVRTTLMQITNGRHGGAQTAHDKTPPSRCAVSVLGTMTRIELEQRVSTGLLRDGFLGRFVLVPYNGRRGWLSEPPAWTPAMIQQKESLVAWLRDLAQSREHVGHVFDRLTPDAHARRQEWYELRGRELEDQAATSGDEADAAVSEAFGRLQTTALKVATVAAVSEWSPPQSLALVSIEQRHVDYGILFAEHALAEIQDLAQHSVDNPYDRYAQRVLAHLARNGTVSKRDLLRRVKQADMTPVQRWGVVESLYPEEVHLERVSTGGRPRLLVSLPVEQLYANGVSAALEVP